MTSAAAVCLTVLLLFAGLEQPASVCQKDSIAVKSAIAAILEKHTLEWMTIPGVVGTAEGVHRGKPCILILVTKKTRRLEGAFPPSINGVRLLLREVGDVRRK